jgi:hypothetical protein
MDVPKLADLAGALPASVRIQSPADNVLLGEHFSAGLDLSELSSRGIPSGRERAANVAAPK